VHSTGMSQPPKPAIFAPIRLWTELSAVLRSSAVCGVLTGKILASEVCSYANAHSQVRQETRAHSRFPVFSFHSL
jgi:hypothetical protein